MLRDYRIEMIRHERVVIQALSIQDAEIQARCLVQSAPKDTCKLHGIIDAAAEQEAQAKPLEVKVV